MTAADEHPDGARPDQPGLVRALRDLVAPDDVDRAVLALRAMRFGRLVERHLQVLLRPTGLDRSEFSVLLSLLLAPPERGQSPTELARTVVQTTSGMTKTVNRLVTRRLVRREDDASDARGVVVTLTVEGRDTAERLLDDLASGFDEVLGLTTTDDRTGLAVALAAVLPALEGSADVTRT